MQNKFKLEHSLIPINPPDYFLNSSKPQPLKHPPFNQESGTQAAQFPHRSLATTAFSTTHQF